MRQNRRRIILYVLSAATAVALGAEPAVIIGEAHDGGTRMGRCPRFRRGPSTFAIRPPTGASTCIQAMAR
jgi:hypothetical protein